jgi:hypothetical protein
VETPGFCHSMSFVVYHLGRYCCESKGEIWPSRNDWRMDLLQMGPIGLGIFGLPQALAAQTSR